MNEVNHLFAYGTLIWPEVLESVIGRHVEGAPAILPGYVRHRIKGEHYPAIIPSAGDLVSGILYKGLSETEFQQLDRFEGEEYVRLNVWIDDIDARVYVIAERWRHIIDECAWHPEQMSREHLEAFCRDYKRWLRD